MFCKIIILKPFPVGIKRIQVSLMGMLKNRTFLFFILLAMAASFCITCDFAIVKPASSSIFIAHYSASKIPFAWLVLIPLNLAVVNVYNFLLMRIGCFPLLVSSVVFVFLLNTGMALFGTSLPVFPFLHYVLKDIYVLLMFQQLWSIIHVTVKMEEAKYLYGIIFGVGGIGAVLGSYITKTYAILYGSEHLLFISVPIYTLFLLIFYLLVQTSKRYTQSDELNLLTKKTKATPKGGFSILAKSRYLQYVLLIVVSMQLTATVVEYQFNMHLETLYPLKDVRTSFTGMLFGYVNMATVALQFIGSSLFIHFLGVARSHLLIPCVLSFFAAANLFYPSFSMVSFTFGSIKSLDYSIFRILTEMLYIPLSVHEKFAGKAVIDVFSYRTARGFASLLVIGLQVIAPLSVETVLRYGAFVVLLIWMLSTLGIAKLFTASQEVRA